MIFTKPPICLFFWTNGWASGFWQNPCPMLVRQWKASRTPYPHGSHLGLSEQTKLWLYKLIAYSSRRRVLWNISPEKSSLVPTTKAVRNDVLKVICGRWRERAGRSQTSNSPREIQRSKTKYVMRVSCSTAWLLKSSYSTLPLIWEIFIRPWVQKYIKYVYKLNIVDKKP